VNGVLLLAGERARRHSPAAAVPAPASASASASKVIDPGSGVELDRDSDVEPATDGDTRLSTFGARNALFVGASQALALLPGISRSGVSMLAGLARGLSHEDAARFSFLLATPVILAAGALKLPDLFGPLGDGIRGPVLAGSVASFVGAYAAVRWLTRWFQTRTLTPFGVYCLAAGALSLLVLTSR
jgi:undecaprenyl-diphosphatase